MTKGKNRTADRDMAFIPEVGKLRKVLVCPPGLAHTRLTPSNCDELLFDDVLWVNNAKRDHFDFVTKMRERDVEVVEMPILLAETMSNPAAKKWILDHQIVANEVGLGLVSEIRGFLDSLDAKTLAEYLLGGLSTVDVPDKYSNEFLKMAGRRRELPSIFFRPFLTRCIHEIRRAGFTAASRSIRSTGRCGARRRCLMAAIYKFHPSFAAPNSKCGGAIRRRTTVRATLEGGDVLPIGNGNVLIGMSERTSRQAITQLAGGAVRQECRKARHHRRDAQAEGRDAPGYCVHVL